MAKKRQSINHEFLKNLSQNQLAIATYKLGVTNTKTVKGAIVIECNKGELLSNINRQLSQGTFPNRIEALQEYLVELTQNSYRDWGQEEIDKITGIKQVKKAWDLLDDQRIFNLIVDFIQTAQPDCYEEFDEICEKLGFYYTDKKEDELIYPSQKKIGNLIKTMNYVEFYHSVIRLATWQENYSTYSNYAYSGGIGYYIPTSYILSLGEFSHQLSEVEALQYLMRWLKTDAVWLDKDTLWDAINQSLKLFLEQKILLANKVILRDNPLKQQIENRLQNTKLSLFDHDGDILSWHPSYSQYLILVSLINEMIEIKAENLSEAETIINPSNYVQKREQYQEATPLIFKGEKTLTFSDIDQAINWGIKILKEYHYHWNEIANIEEVMPDIEEILFEQLEEKWRQDLTDLLSSILSHKIDDKILYNSFKELPLDFHFLELEEVDFETDKPSRTFLAWLNQLRQKKTYWLIEFESATDPNIKLYYPYCEFTKIEREKLNVDKLQREKAQEQKFIIPLNDQDENLYPLENILERLGYNLEDFPETDSDDLWGDSLPDIPWNLI